MRKPFDAIAEGLVLNNGAENRTWLELFMACVACLLEELPHANQLLTDLL